MQYKHNNTDKLKEEHNGARKVGGWQLYERRVGISEVYYGAEDRLAVKVIRKRKYVSSKLFFCCRITVFLPLKLLNKVTSKKR